MYLGQMWGSAPPHELSDAPATPTRGRCCQPMPIADPDSSDAHQRVPATRRRAVAHQPAGGCRFHPRCPKAEARLPPDRGPPRCAPKPGDRRRHTAACHFPLADGEVASCSAEPYGDRARLALPRLRHGGTVTQGLIIDVTVDIGRSGRKRPIEGRSPWRLASRGSVTTGWPSCRPSSSG